MYLFSLARRYATARLVNYLACAAIAVCVLVQVVTMAVLDGMLADYRRRIQGLGEQVTVYLPRGEDSAALAEEIARSLEAIPEVKGSAPVLQRYATIGSNRVNRPVLVLGVDLAKEAANSRMPDYVLDQPRGELSWLAPGQKEPDPTAPGMWVGKRLAQMLGLDGGLVASGVSVELHVARPDDESLVRQRFRIATRYSSGISYYDEYFAYIPLEEANRLFAPDREGQASYLAVWLTDPVLAGEPLARVAEEILALADAAATRRGHGYCSVTTVEEQWSEAFASMAHENALMEIVMAFISLASAFAIFAIMYTLASDRVRDIGILRSLGAGRREILVLFTLSGAAIGVAGAVIGAAGGLLLAPHIGAAYEWIRGEPLYPPHLFGVKELPILIDGTTVAIRTAASAGIAMLASLPAALWAACRQPLEALRHE